MSTNVRTDFTEPASQIRPGCRLPEEEPRPRHNRTSRLIAVPGSLFIVGLNCGAHHSHPLHPHRSACLLCTLTAAASL